ncbi:hydratase [Clostridium sp. JS66]|uniref:hydratase n=1 Tax=Clostridium sp. JS66 TaxID=3064705 RepID=UPI00298EA64E|nr:hydratase [Clostridium sp. JS66]WPC41243.1 hydratase [Clostridium sp. JS66]
MINLYGEGAYLLNGNDLIFNNKESDECIKAKLGEKYLNQEEAKKNTIAYGILQDHNKSGNPDKLQLKFDALTSHDITFVGIVQTARASGLEKFPIPYVLTNCHNSLCAVGGTINEDDHLFGLSAAKKYGGIFVPPHIAVIHQYMREMMAGCGKMILGSDSHTRYGALGTMAIGEGGGELVKQLLSNTYDVDYPEVVGVYLTGTPNPGIGPQDVALSIIGAVFKNGFVKNRVMEFVGPGIKNLSVEYRTGIDVMTTETTCLTSIWCTDDKVKDYLEVHQRGNDYSELNPEEVAYYDKIITVDLSKVQSMIALPFHPSNVYTINELNANMMDILDKVEKEGQKLFKGTDLKFSLKDKVINGRLFSEQGSIAGCAGGNYENICAAANILDGKSIGNAEFTLSVYPSSMPVYQSLVDNGIASKLIPTGTVLKTAFCGPCFGGGDTPANNSLSVRHTTRNFPNREGSKPGDGQIASVALMDARSIAATAVNKGLITAATELEGINSEIPKYYFNKTIYDNRVLQSYNKGNDDTELRFGPNIADWPKMEPLTDNMLLQVASVLLDPVTTTDELIPSGDTSSYRSNPHKLASFTLCRKDPHYVGRSKEIQAAEIKRLEGSTPEEDNTALKEAYEKLSAKFCNFDKNNTLIGSMIYANKPGDGSAREQAASCQKVLGGFANIAKEYATKRYRSNLINWGILPLLMDGEPEFKCGDFIYLTDVVNSIRERKPEIKGYIVGNEMKEISLSVGQLTDNEIEILLSGCLINFNKNKMDK